MIARVERAIRSIGEIGRVHVCRWGDGGEHLHWWFLARPARLPQLIGSFAAIWDDILPPTPEDVWRANIDAVVSARRRCSAGGREGRGSTLLRRGSARRRRERALGRGVERQLGLPAGGENGEERRRREHLRHAGGRTRDRAVVAAGTSTAATGLRARGRPRPSRATNAPSGSVSNRAACRRCARVPGSIRSSCSRASIAAARSASPGWSSCQSVTKVLVVPVAALTARTVAGGERGRLVQEEQLRVPARLQELALAARGTRAGRRSSASPGRDA